MRTIDSEQENPFLRIKGGFTPPDKHRSNFNSFVFSMERLLKEMIPPGLIPSPIELGPDETIEPYFERLASDLPLVFYSNFHEAPTTVAVALLCSSKNTQGVGRYICDFFSKWGIPGKQLTLVSTRAVLFQFLAYPQEHFFLTDVIIEIEDQKDLILLKHNMPKLIRDLRINILAVQHTRNVVSLKPLTLEQKRILMQENIATLMEQGRKDFDPSLFELMHNILIKAAAEDTATRIKDQIVPLLEMRPAALDRDLYREMQHFVLHLKDSFIAVRDLRHVNRVVSYHYIFRKVVSNGMQAEPEKRHISLKVFRSRLNDPHGAFPVLGVLVALNLVRENEMFEERHLLQAIRTCLPGMNLVEDSRVVDLRQDDRVRTVYLEIKHPNSASFSSAEINELRRNLPKEIKHQVESVINPIFVHRNEEEVMRSILDLSRQLKYLHDIPQVIVNFHKQTDFEISFIVILLRLIKEDQKTLKDLFRERKISLKVNDHESKIVGSLRKRYNKEANVFEVRLNKKEFLRRDYSLDLYKARLTVINELTRAVGELRDYNGGMIGKQYEILSELKEGLLKLDVKNDFLLENFFYSLSPSYMQNLLDPKLLQKFFLILLNLIDQDYAGHPYRFETACIADYLLVMVGAASPSFHEPLFKALEGFTSSFEITQSVVTVYDISCVGFILHFNTETEKNLFLQLLQDGMKKWLSSADRAPLSESPSFSLLGL